MCGLAPFILFLLSRRQLFVLILFDIFYGHILLLAKRILYSSLVCIT